MKGRIHHSSPLVELRRHYESIAAGFGPPPDDVVVESAQLGQIKGEWLSVGETQPQRLVIYFHGGGYISGSPESHRTLIARLPKTAGRAALDFGYRLRPEIPCPA